MLTRTDIFNYVEAHYDTQPDYPFKKFPNYAALRHEKHGKWYGLIMNVHLAKLGLDGDKSVDILNVKCPPEIIGSLRDGEKILPAYHMDKAHWISVILQRTEANEVYNLIGQSYDLTKK